MTIPKVTSSFLVLQRFAKMTSMEIATGLTLPTLTRATLVHRSTPVVFLLFLFGFCLDPHILVVSQSDLDLLCLAVVR